MAAATVLAFHPMERLDEGIQSRLLFLFDLIGKEEKTSFSRWKQVQGQGFFPLSRRSLPKERRFLLPAV
ncbi:hypothetical protein [Neobacillus soli]|nr:hypothetical protein [Neobacillus soli]